MSSASTESQLGWRQDEVAALRRDRQRLMLELEQVTEQRNEMIGLTNDLLFAIGHKMTLDRYVQACRDFINSQAVGEK